MQRARGLALVLFSFTACVDPKVAGTPEKAGDFAKQLYTLFGERVVECTGQPDTAVAKSLRVDELVERIGNSVTKKRLSYERASAKTCLDQLAVVGCEDLLSLFIEGKGPCDLAFKGLVAAEGDCYEANECAPGHFCELVGDCLGVCRKFTRLGGACGAGTVCEPDTQCIGGLCRERANEDDDCAGTTGIGCKAGLICLPTSASTGVCSRRQEGGRCRSSNICALGYQCGVTDPNADDGECVLTKREGEACTPGVGECAAFTSCVAGAGGNTCQLWGGVGATCGLIQSEFVLCIDSWCGLDPDSSSQEVGRCQAAFDNGEPCNIDEQCTSGICDPITQVCVSACPLQ